ncbi:MAG: SiaB family protein kinase [Ignavibacteriaceae bacterium]
MRISIRNKLVLLLILPLFIIFTTAVYYSSDYIEEFVLQKYISSHNDLMNAHALFFNQVLKNSSEIAEKTAFLLKEPNKFDDQKLKALMHRIIKSEPIILGAALAFEPYVFQNRQRYAPFYFDKNGKIDFIDISNKKNGYDYIKKDYEWYRIPAKFKKSHWSEPFYSGVLKGLKVVTYSVPIMDDEKFLGVFVIDISLEKLDWFLKESIETKTFRFALISSKGTYISHPDKNRIIDKSLIDDSASIINYENRVQLLTKINKEKRGFYPIPRAKNNKSAFAFFSKVPVSGWSIIAYSYEDDLTSPIRNIFTKTYLLLLIFFIVSFFIVAFFSNKLLSPIKAIRNFTRKISAGDYPGNLTSKSKDEFDDLIKDLNIMNYELQKRENDLSVLNKELENRVEKRTIELKDLLREAKKLSTAIEQSPVIVTITDKNGVIEYVNPEYSRVTGYSSDEVKGKIHTLITSRDTNTDNLSSFNKLIESGEKFIGEFERTNKSGSNIWIKVSGVGVADEFQKIQNYVIIEDDISEAKASEMQLKLNSELLSRQNSEIALRNKYIVDSINYAKRIQDAVLPSDDYIARLHPDSFLIFVPKDVVSGDFYWITKIGDKKIFAVVDCTGHGVPGALMSIMGNTLLNEIVNLLKITDPGKILDNLNRRIIEELQKENHTTANDGMDITIGVYDFNFDKLHIASAYRTVFYFQDNMLNEIKGDRKSIGDTKKELSFTTHEICIKGVTELYTFTDGIVDQNDSDNRKFGLRRLKEFLYQNHSIDMNSQRNILLQSIKDHKGEETQRDDITFWGFRFFPNNPDSLINYNGIFDYNKILSLGEELNIKLSDLSDPKLIKTIQFVSIELMQNISYYSTNRSVKDKKDYGIGIIDIRRTNNSINISAENAIDEFSYERILKTVLKINSMSEIELKELRKAKLKNKVDPASKGGGIGLIEIVKRTRMPIQVSKKSLLPGKNSIVFTVIIHLGELNGKF